MARNLMIDLSKKVVADKRFTMDDKEYQFGEEVDLTGKNMRQIERLFRHRFVRTVNEGVTTKAVGRGGKNPPSRSAVADVVDAPVEAVATNTVTLNHVGGGYYEAVDVAGTNVLSEKVQGKDNAKMIAEQLGFAIA